MRPRRWAAAVAACAALMSASCTQPGDGATTSPTPSPIVVSPTPSPSVATPTPTPSAADKAAAAVVGFWTVVDQLATDPDKSLNALHDVARDQMFDQWSLNIRQYRYKELHQLGMVEVDDLSVKPTERKGRYHVTACLDASKTDLVDKNGKSVVDKSRPARVAYRYTVDVDGAKGFVVDEAVIGPC